MLRATQPSATWMSTTSAPHSFASPRTCPTIVSSAGPCSSGTRIRLYIKRARSPPPPPPPPPRSPPPPPPPPAPAAPPPHWTHPSPPRQRSAPPHARPP